MTYRTCAVSVLLAWGLAASPLAARAQYPDHPIRVVLPYAPGAAGDVAMRQIQPLLEKRLGQPLVVDYKTGAGGNIGTRIVSQAKPDGYTLLYTINGPLVTAPTLYKKTLGYDPLRDLQPVSLVGTSPNVLVVPSSLKVDNVKDFVALVKGRGNSLNYGSVGPGSSAHLAMEMFKESAGVDLAHIPYSGFPQVISAIIGGDVQAGFMVPAIAVPQARDGKVKLLAVTSLQPSEALPGVPTMASQGYPDFEAISWNAVLVPAGTPTPIVERLNSELARIIGSEAVRKQLALQYFTPAPSTPEALTARIKNEKARWDQVIEKLNLSLD